MEFANGIKIARAKCRDEEFTGLRFALTCPQVRSRIAASGPGFLHGCQEFQPLPYWSEAEERRRAGAELCLQRPPKKRPETMPLVRFDPQSQPRRVVYSLAAVGAYVFAFFPLYRLMTSPGTAALATVPVSALAWLWGWRVGLVAGLLSLPLNMLLLNLAGQEGWDAVFRQGGGLGQVMIVLIGGGVGRLRDVDRRLKEEITERKRTEERLLQSAMYDPLTELANRKLLMDRLTAAAQRRKRRGESYLFGVLILDLDRFKNINDSLGYEIGDQLLIAVAQRLEDCVRSEDTVARLGGNDPSEDTVARQGGDEFIILLEDLRNESDATRVAERIQKQLMSPFNLDEHEVFTTASIGIALSSTGYDQVENLLRDADTAMYRAKAAGKARHVMFDSTMHARAVAILQLENDLRRAIERQEFRNYYQPIVLLETGAVIGFEALLRWQHPDRGLVLPAEFIPVTEETGLIVPIGRWALREACRQMHAWQARFPSTPPLYISVNITSQQLSQPELLQEINQILRETGLDSRSLNLEITETVIMENIKSVISMLTLLRDLKVRACMDDFGTGYSSLNYLNRLPLDGLKIDLSFVSGTGVDLQNPDVVRTIMTLSRDLGKFVIAEGIETVEQLAQLRTLECKYGQGYLFSKPLDGEAVEKLIPTRLGPPA